MRNRRLLSIVLTLAMLVGMFPGLSLTAYAEGNTTEITPSNISGTMNITLTIAPPTVAVTGVSLNPSTAQTIDVDGTVSFTAIVAPDDATDKSVKWSVGGTDTGAVKLYTDADCTTEVGTTATSTLTVYAKGESAGSATVTAASNADSSKSATCAVIVQPHTHSFTYSADGATITATCNSAGCNLTENKVTLTIGDPTNIYWDDKSSSHEFTLVGLEAFNSATGKTISASDIVYYKGDNQSQDIKNNTVKGATYKARLTVEGVRAEHSFMFTAKPIVHTHSFTYTANGAVITATCTSTTGTCDLTNKQATLTLNAPEHTTYGDGKAANATFTGEIPGVTNPVINYRRSDTLLGTTAPTDAGTYTAWCQLGSATARVEYTINKATNPGWTTLPQAKQGLVYKGSGQELITAGATNTGDIRYGLGTADSDENTNYTGAVPSAVNAGTYYVWCKIDGGKNYTSTAAQKIEVSIAKADITPSVSIVGWTYGETAATPMVGDTANPGNGEVTYTYKVKDADDSTYTSTVPTAAGNYTVKAAIAETANYNGGEATKDFTITQATPIINVPTPDAVTYDPAKTLESVTLPDGWAWVTKTTVPTVSNNGYAAEYTVPDYANYNYTNVDGYDAQTHKVTRTVSLTVNKADSTPANVTANNRTYDGTEKPLVTVDGEPTGGTMQYALGTNDADAPESGWDTEIPTATNAGTYYVWYRVKGDGNYNGVDPVPVTSTIAKAAIEPTVSISGWTYGESANAPSVTGNTGNGAVTIEYSAKSNGSYTKTVPSDAGTYYVRATVAATDNYKGATSKPVSFTVAKAKVTFTADNKSSVYGEKLAALTYQTSGKIKNGDDLGVTVSTTATKTSNVGDYPITVSWNGNANYSVTVKKGTYTIGKKALTVTAAAKSKTYGDADPALTYKASGLVGSDKLTGALTRASGENVGSYAITQGTLKASGNYSLTFKGAKLTISKKALTVTAAAKSKTYGDADPALTYTASGLVGSDKLTGALTRASGENVGSYAITQGTLKASGNYTLTYKGAKLTIGKKNVTVVAEAKSKTYGSKDPALTYTVTGLLGSDKATGALAREAGEDVGSYAITQGTLKVSNNYNLKYTGAKLTVGKRALTVTAYARIKYVGEADPELTYRAVGLVGDDALTGALERAKGEKAGSYAITQGTLSAGKNYKVTFVGAKLTIAPQNPVTPNPDYTLLAKLIASGKTDFNLAWTKVADADGYDLFLEACGTSDTQLIASVPSSAERVYKITGLKKGTGYKAYVQAWKTVKGVKTPIGKTSPNIHAITGGYNAEECNPAEVTVQSTKLTLAVGKTETIKAEVVGVKDDRKVVDHAAVVRYYSSDRNVATVSASGKVTAIGAGTCTIYVMSNNGIRTGVKVTVQDRPTGISFKKTQYSVKLGETLKLAGQAVTDPAGVVIDCTWISGNPAVATVSPDGVVTGVKAGTVAISVTAANGATATTKVKVE